MTMTASHHAADCGWQFEQYPHECDCGVYEGKLGRINIDRQLFEAMFATLQRKGHVFDHYANLHADKGTEDGNRKALANRDHATDIKKITDRVTEVRKAGHRTMYLEMLDVAYEAVRANGKKPVAFVMTPDFARLVMEDFRKVYGAGFVEGGTLVAGSSYRGCDLVKVSEQHWHSALICCSEDSPILKLAMQMRKDG